MTAQRRGLERGPVQLLRLPSPHASATVPRVGERSSGPGSTGHLPELPLPALQGYRSWVGGFYWEEKTKSDLE